MNTEIHKLPEVYGTSRAIPKTYVQRSNVDGRFVNDITREKHIVIHGSSKQGKTCLRKFHLNESEAIIVQCTSDSTKATIYEMLLKHAGIQSSVTNQKTVKGTAKVSVKFEASAGFFGLAKAKGESAVEGSLEGQDSTTTEEFEIDIEDPNDIVRVLQASGFKKFIILEDFHYIDEDVQKQLSIDLKVFHDISTFVFVIIGVWLENNRLLTYNGDLNGRIATIDVDTWSDADLLAVIRNGYPLLNIDFPESVEAAIVSKSQSNVGLLQELCFRICEKYDIPQTTQERRLIGTIEDVSGMASEIAESQAARYRNFLVKFAEGLGETEYKMYRWVAWALIHASSTELRHGLRSSTIFQRIRDKHPNGESLQHNNVTQALDRISKVQFKHKLQPLILDYSNNYVKVVDVNFTLYLETHEKDSLHEYIGYSE